MNVDYQIYIDWSRFVFLICILCVIHTRLFPCSVLATFDHTVYILRGVPFGYSLLDLRIDFRNFLEQKDNSI